MNAKAFFVERWLFRSITYAKINIKDVFFTLLQPNITIFFSFSTSFSSFFFLTTFSPFCFHLFYISFSFSLLFFPFLSFIFLPLPFDYTFPTTCSITLFFFVSHECAYPYAHSHIHFSNLSHDRYMHLRYVISNQWWKFSRGLWFQP